eukprot:1105109-Pyramimonas_sp.AAC.2
MEETLSRSIAPLDRTRVCKATHIQHCLLCEQSCDGSCPRTRSLGSLDMLTHTFASSPCEGRLLDACCLRRQHLYIHSEVSCNLEGSTCPEFKRLAIPKIRRSMPKLVTDLDPQAARELALLKESSRVSDEVCRFKLDVKGGTG